MRAGSSGALPVGVQVAAGMWQGYVALAAAAQIEEALGGWQPPLWPPRRAVADSIYEGATESSP